jgi:hypothetical protein
VQRKKNAHAEFDLEGQVAALTAADIAHEMGNQIDSAEDGQAKLGSAHWDLEEEVGVRRCRSVLDLNVAVEADSAVWVVRTGFEMAGQRPVAETECDILAVRIWEDTADSGEVEIEVAVGVEAVVVGPADAVLGCNFAGSHTCQVWAE